MWEFFLRQLLKEVGRKAASKFFSDDANAPEANVDRIKRDLHLQEYNDALALYSSDPTYWEKWYTPTPRPDNNVEMQHESARAAGVPSGYNVFEYGYPEPGGPDGRASFNARFGNWRSSPASASPSPAPDSSGSFNSRYGSWGSTSAGDSDNPRSPLLREPEKYRRSEAPTPPAPTSTAFDAPAPTGPVAPGARDLGFNISGLPSWMKNALAYRPQDESAVPTSPNTNSSEDDPRNIRVLRSRLVRY